MTEYQEPEENESLEEWLAEEHARLDEGFQFEPVPVSETGGSSTLEGTLAGAGIGAGVLAGAATPHDNPVTFEGVKPFVLINALRQALADSDTRFQVKPSTDAVEVTVLQAQDQRPSEFLPALTVTLIDKDNTLTVSVSDLNQSTVRGALGSMGSAVLQEGASALFRGRRRGPGGMIAAAGSVIQGIEKVVEDIQDLGLRARAWKVIDRVGNASEQAYLDEQDKLETKQQARDDLLTTWTHCPYCGRAYSEEEASLTRCPSCGGNRGAKPG